MDDFIITDEVGGIQFKKPCDIDMVFSDILRRPKDILSVKVEPARYRRDLNRIKSKGKCLN